MLGWEAKITRRAEASKISCCSGGESGTETGGCLQLCFSPRKERGEGCCSHPRKQAEVIVSWDLSLAPPLGRTGPLAHPCPPCPPEQTGPQSSPCWGQGCVAAPTETPPCTCFSISPISSLRQMLSQSYGHSSMGLSVPGITSSFPFLAILAVSGPHSSGCCPCDVPGTSPPTCIPQGLPVPGPHSEWVVSDLPG